MVKHCALTNVNSDRGFESWTGHEVQPLDCQSSLEVQRQRILDFPDTGHIYSGDEQMLRILDRSHSVPTVTELIFVRAQCLTILL
jgi:hypothetical protein